MGLNVKVYKNIKKTNSDDYNFIAYVMDKNWNYKIKNLERNAKYTGERCNVSVDYAYSAHNRFREALINIIDRLDLINKSNDEINWPMLEKEKDIPFYDFINFADNEGCLDCETNTKLFNQFKEWQEKAMDYFRHDNYFKSKYNDWLSVFENGKQKNAVVVFG